LKRWNLKFIETSLADAYIIEPEIIEDERGFFARTYCVNEFAEKGIRFHTVQCNISFNKKKGTVRGMHYQEAPHEEAKLVRCAAGSVHDIILDLRPQSSTYRKWMSMTLTASNHRMLYIPKGFAHGFQTLEDNTEVHYQMSDFYVPHAARGLCWNDSAFDIQWPLPITVISLKDQQYPAFIVKR
jgi:dTDP-4-dehydrorhamnose 3,5-epimerase